MRKLIFILPLVFIFSCGEQNPTEDNTLTELRAKKDSLKAIHTEVSSKIAELDQKIAELDTTKKLNVVTTYEVQATTFKHFIDIYGTVEADKSITIYPETNGVIESIKVNEGARVKKGQLLMVLDADVLRQNLTEINTQYELANTVYERQSRLWEQNIGSEVQLLEAKARRDALSSQRAALNSKINMSNVSAPFDGVVDEIFPKSGEMALPQQPLIRLVNLDNVYIESDVFENYIDKIKIGSEVVVEFPALGQEYTSKVEHVGQYIDPNNRTFKVQVKIPNDEDLIKPNLLAKVKILDEVVKDSAITLPNRLILQSPEGDDYVMLLNEKDNSVKRQMISVGSSYNSKTLIVDGLDSDALVIDKGSRSIRDGQKVQVEKL